MKVENIFVGVNGALSFTSGAKGVAVYPARKGDKESYVLLESGKMMPMSGSRINGVGISRYLAENGFALAEPGDSLAAQLADMLDMREGSLLVGDACRTRAAELQSKFGGKSCTLVPFDENLAPVPVTVEAQKGIQTIVFDQLEGFAGGQVSLEYVPGSGLSGARLHSCWLVGPEGDASHLPRNTEYGGVLERAVFTICNSGLASLVGEQNLRANEENDMYPRGQLELALHNGDRVLVGVTADDVAEVVYRREDVVVYSRKKAGTGIQGMRLGEVIGYIAAVIVRVAELDAKAAKKQRKKSA